MSNEATIRIGIQIKVGAVNNIGGINYRPPTDAFYVDVGTTSPKGPTPGFVLATPIGVAVDFSKLTTPGLCRIENQDPANYLEYGIGDSDTLEFYPLGEVGPGRAYVIELSRNLGIDQSQTGTFPSAGTKQFWVRGNAASVPCSIEAFEK